MHISKRGGDEYKLDGRRSKQQRVMGQGEFLGLGGIPVAGEMWTGEYFMILHNKLSGYVINFSSLSR